MSKSLRKNNIMPQIKSFANIMLQIKVFCFQLLPISKYCLGHLPAQVKAQVFMMTVVK